MAARPDAGTLGDADAPSASGTIPALDRPARAWSRFWRTPLAAAGGLVLVLAFPGSDHPGLALLGPAALALAVHGRRFRTGLWLGLVFGLAFFVPLLSWAGIYVGPLPWLALAGWEALHLALLGGATALVSRLRWWPLWSAALWVADEAVRGRFVLGGFPWGRLGLSQTEGPLLSLAAYGGVPLVSFAVALEGTLLAAAIPALYRAWRAASAGSASSARAAAAALGTAVLAVVAVAAVPAVGLVAWLPLAGPSLTAGGPAVTVAVVQGNVPRLGLDFNAQRRAVLDNHVQATLDLADDVAAGRARSPASSCGRRTAPTSIPTATPTPPSRSTGRPPPSRRPSWSVPSSTVPAARCATPRSSGIRRPAPGAPTSSGIRCRWPSTCRPVPSSASSARRSTWSGPTSSAAPLPAT